MTDQPTAAELYAEGRELEAQYDYYGALKKYKQSLQLYNDEVVEAAYYKMLATIGPL
jgi:hypothetical protein